MEEVEMNTDLKFGEAAMERSKGFVSALQELKNLRPQLYSAAEYCEKSYIHSEQKQMVLDNLKEYAMRALVNAVDHFGTVAYKLNDLLEQQSMDVNTIDLKMTTLNQKVWTCRTYMDKEGLRQQKLMAIVPRHHKRYTLPSSVSKRVHFGPTSFVDPRRFHAHARPRNTPASISPSSKTLSWHLGSEPHSPSSTLKNSASSEVQKSSPKPTGVFRLLDNEEQTQAKSSAPAQPQPLIKKPASDGATYKDLSMNAKPIRHQQQQQIIRAPPRTKSMLSAFFVKHKTQKLKAGA